MNRRGFLHSLFTAAGAIVLAPEEAFAALAPPRTYFDLGRKPWLERGVLVAGFARIIHPGVYAVVGYGHGGCNSLCSTTQTVIVTPSAIDRGASIDIPLVSSFGMEPVLVDVRIAKIGDLGSEQIGLQP